MIADSWQEAKQIIGDTQITLGPQASDQWLNAPDHLAMVLSRYRAAAALIGNAQTVLEVGCGEGIGARILAKGRQYYFGIDTDAEAVHIAEDMHGDFFRNFEVMDVTQASNLPLESYGASVSLDVIEHIPAAEEDAFLTAAVYALRTHGVLVIGTPNAAFEHLASPQSRAGHINLYTHERLHALMMRYFHTVQSFGMQDTALHLGHPDARHYLLIAGIGPREAA